MMRATDLIVSGGVLAIIQLVCYSIFSEEIKSLIFPVDNGVNRIAKVTKDFECPHKNHGTASPILYVHFHKSGGTSVCNTMKEQGYNMTDMMGNDRIEGKRDINCNVEISGPANDIDWYHSMQTCRLLEAYTMDDNGIAFARDNFLAVEVPFHDAMPCPRFRSFSIMRDPVERLISHLSVHERKEQDVVRWINNKTSCQNRNYINGYPTVNNMVIRQLLGRDRYMDTRPIDEDDLEEAKKRVDAFDAFVPLEYLYHEKTLNLLKRTVPEYYNGLQRDHVTANVNKEKKKDGGFSQEFMKQVSDENTFDTKLYKYMLEKLGIEDS